MNQVPHATPNGFAEHRYGCSYAVARALNAGQPLTAQGTAAQRYRYQHVSATSRGIEWLFTFPTWLAVWEKSGKWDQRGMGSDKYCMARFGDVGPYSPQNVEIITCSKNSSDARKNHPNAGAVPGHGRGWSLDKRAKARPYRAFFRGREIGRYATAAEATSARDAELAVFCHARSS